MKKMMQMIGQLFRVSTLPTQCKQRIDITDELEDTERISHTRAETQGTSLRRVPQEEVTRNESQNSHYFAHLRNDNTFLSSSCSDVYSCILMTCIAFSSFRVLFYTATADTPIAFLLNDVDDSLLTFFPCDLLFLIHRSCHSKSLLRQLLLSLFPRLRRQIHVRPKNCIPVLLMCPDLKLSSLHRRSWHLRAYDLETSNSVFWLFLSFSFVILKKSETVHLESDDLTVIVRNASTYHPQILIFFLTQSTDNELSLLFTGIRRSLSTNERHPTAFFRTLSPRWTFPDTAPCLSWRVLKLKPPISKSALHATISSPST